MHDRCTAKKFIFNGGRQIGSRYTKVIYTQFTDGTYTREIPAPKYNGFLGPTLKGTVGEKIRIHFKNMASRPYTMHPETNVWYNDDSEGALYDDNTPTSQKFDDQVQPGESWTYNWELRANFGPTGDDENCIGVPYSSHNKPPKDRDTGLVGMMVVCKPGVLRHDGSRVDVDREYVLFMGAVNESFSWLIDENVNRCRNPAECNSLVKSGNKEFIESTIYQQINGYIYGNGPDFEVCSGEKVVFYAFGINTGIQTVTIYGGIQSWLNRRFEGVSIQPGIAKVITVNPEGTGRWLMAINGLQYGNVKGLEMCAGETVLLSILGFAGDEDRYQSIIFEGNSVKYSGQNVDAISIGNGISATVIMTPDNIDGHLYVRDTMKFIGTKYAKAVYREFTDGSFKHLVKRSFRDYHLGILGPFVRVEVGDTLEIVYKNMVNFPNTINMRNLKGDNHMVRDQAENGVPPGKTTTFRWYVPERSGPGPFDPNCVGRSYDSTTNPLKDSNTGLFGPLIVCRKGVLDKNGNRNDNVDREFAVNFEKYDETKIEG
ncbi:hephaestin-like protein [Mytilus californianus]|uniref:hephaestin-like protein n=1 Tax=Mytilus californianus TaxID=6549 RepID=UPI00224628F8|nr:hephaestin-like protein [Mytilus californianus]